MLCFLSCVKYLLIAPWGGVRLPARNGREGLVRYASLRNPSLHPPRGGNRTGPCFLILPPVFSRAIMLKGRIITGCTRNAAFFNYNIFKLNAIFHLP